MDKEKAISYIENSFLRELIIKKDVTDISYNGSDIYYLHNELGRKKSKIKIDEEDAKDFIRQIANLCEKQFSYQTPKLDVSIGKYRINAVHQSIARKNNENCLNFAIRIASNQPIISKNSNFLNADLVSLFDVLIQSQTSIVIGGCTGSGKTELQKYLISAMPEFTRVIVIDNVLELDNLNIDDLDMNIWQADEKNKEASIQELVRNALRSNPDWLIVAESRGKEMLEVLNSAMTGHPIITTLHALDVDSMPKRIGRMVMMNDQKQDYEMVMADVNYNFRFFVYLKRIINGDGKVIRFIQEVAEIDEKGIKNTIYSCDGGMSKVYKIRKAALKNLSYKDNKRFVSTFVKEGL